MPFDRSSSILEPSGHMPAGQTQNAAIDVLDRLLAFLNRRDHFLDICDWLEQHRPERAIIVLPATQRDRYAYFVHRLVVEPNQLASPRFDLGQVTSSNWRLDDVTRTITERLQRLKPRTAAGDSTALSMEQIEGAVILSHVIDKTIVKPRGQAFLKTWFQHFGQQCPTPSRGQTIAILCVFQKENDRNDALTKALDEAAKDLPGDIIFRAKPLTTISVGDYQEWVAQYDDRAGGETWGMFLQRSVERIFPNDDMELPLSEISDALIQFARTSPLAPHSIGFREA